jgi:hypothetical protein
MSLRDWILTHIHVDNPVGDLAQDLAIDECAVDHHGRPLETYRELYAHIRGHEGHTTGALLALREASLTRGQRSRRGEWWVACSECPPHVNGDPHFHYEGTRDPKVREHVYKSRRRAGGKTHV